MNEQVHICVRYEPPQRHEPKRQQDHPVRLDLILRPSYGPPMYYTDSEIGAGNFQGTQQCKDAARRSGRSCRRR